MYSIFFYVNQNNKDYFQAYYKYTIYAFYIYVIANVTVQERINKMRQHVSAGLLYLETLYIESLNFKLYINTI